MWAVSLRKTISFLPSISLLPNSETRERERVNCSVFKLQTWNSEKGSASEEMEEETLWEEEDEVRDR